MNPGQGIGPVNIGAAARASGVTSATAVIPRRVIVAGGPILQPFVGPFEARPMKPFTSALQ